MRTFKLGLIMLALSFGVAAAYPAVASAQEQGCKAQCKQDADDCTKMCTEHAPAKVRGRCVSTCKDVEKKCKKDCDKHESGQ